MRGQRFVLGAEAMNVMIGLFISHDIGGVDFAQQIVVPDHPKKDVVFFRAQPVGRFRMAVLEIIEISTVAADCRRLQPELMVVGVGRYMMTPGSENDIDASRPGFCHCFDCLWTDFSLRIEQCSVHVESNYLESHFLPWFLDGVFEERSPGYLESLPARPS